MAEVKKETKTTGKKAKKIYTLEEIKYDPQNSTMAIISCISIVALVLMFVEKKDLFVRYHATQFALFNIVYFIGFIPFIGAPIAGLLSMIFFVLFIIGILKVTKGERFDIPYLSDFALKLMGEID